MMEMSRPRTVMEGIVEDNWQASGLAEIRSSRILG